MADWALRSETTYEPTSYSHEGFIHLSSSSQLLTPLNSFYLGRHDLVLVAIDERHLSAPVVWEDLYQAGQEFPHLYGPLNLDAVVTHARLACDSNGRFDWLIEPK